MKAHKRQVIYVICFWTFAILALILLSCSDSDTVTGGIPGPTPEDPASIELRIAHSRHLNVMEGETWVERFTAIVRNANGVGVPGVKLDLRIISGPGIIVTADSLTDEYGQIMADLIIENISGPTTTEIQVSAGQLTARRTFEIIPITVPVSIKFDESTPALIKVDYSEPQEIELAVQVLDRNGDGIENITLAFSILSGLAQLEPFAETDTGGKARSTLKLDGRFIGELILAASVVHYYDSSDAYTGEGEALIDTLRIMVELENVIGLHFLTPDTTVRQFSGVKEIVLEIVLGNENGRPLPGQIIRLQTNSQIINLNQVAVTDSAGIAASRLLLTGCSGAAVVHAFYDPLQLEDQFTLIVSEPEKLDVSIQLIDPGHAVWNQTTQSVKVVARCLPDGTPAIDLPVRLHSMLNDETSDETSTDSRGVEILSYTPHRSGLERLTVLTPCEIEGGDLRFTVLEGPVQLTGQLEPGEGIDRFRLIRFPFRLVDINGHPVSGEPVHFSSSIGFVADENVITDADGRGETVVHKGNSTGIGELAITFNDHATGLIRVTEIINFPEPGLGHFDIDLDRDYMEVEGGDRSVITFTTTVWDEIGNLLETPWPFVFEIINALQPPAGAHFPNGESIDTIYTESGIGVEYLFAGTATGGLLLRIKTWMDAERNNPREVIWSMVAVMPGPPFQMDIDVNDEGNDVGGGSWAVEVSCRVWDRHRNPVADRIPVVFTLEPEIATIDPGYTGNDGSAGRTPGVAYANMIYHSVNTFNPITISAEVQTERGILTRTIEHVLPLQEGQLGFSVVPGFWEWEDEEEWVEINIMAILTDGHDIEIENAPIFATAHTAGFWREIAMENGNGVLRFQPIELPELGFVWEITIQIDAGVSGYDDVRADPVFIFLRRRE